MKRPARRPAASNSGFTKSGVWGYQALVFPASKPSSKIGIVDQGHSGLVADAVRPGEQRVATGNRFSELDQRAGDGI